MSLGAADVGRWPANVMHDGSDEVVRMFPADAGEFGRIGTVFHGDSGSAARFFYCPKTSRQDRNEGCEHMDRMPLNWSSGVQSPGTFQSEGTDRTSPNNHPTVKPTALMRYLVRLVTPPGGTVLDPFFGSGSTGKACVYEGLNYIGIEREERYAEIADARIAFAKEDHRQRTAQQGINFYD